MTNYVVAQTEQAESVAAAQELESKLSQEFQTEPPEVLVMFGSPAYDLPEIVSSLQRKIRPTFLVGCSSAGEFTSTKASASSACVFAIRRNGMAFSAGLARDLSRGPKAAAQDLVEPFRGKADSEHPYRSALILTDALAGYAEDLMENLTLMTSGAYQLFGGGAADDAKFSRTFVFHGGEVLTNAAVSLEILSHKPLGVGVSHGWIPSSGPLRVTEAAGNRLISLNAVPAVELFQEHAEATGQQFDPTAPLPFFLHNMVGVDTGVGYKLRVPLGVDPEGAVICAAEVPENAVVRIMKSTVESAAEAASTATRNALTGLKGNSPAAALFFDCAATRLRMGGDFGLELDQVSAELEHAPFAGCNTYGQIARIQGQFSGFHNCTAVVCVFPSDSA